MSIFDGMMNKFVNMGDNDDDDDDDLYDDEPDVRKPAKPKKARSMKKSYRDDDDYDDADDGDDTPVIPVRRASKPAPAAPTRAEKPSRAKAGMHVVRDKINLSEVCVIKPLSIDDGPEIVDTLRDNIPIILNLEGIKSDMAQRIFDFASGASRALDGTLKVISDYIFIITPNGCNISGDTKSAEDNSSNSFDYGNTGFLD